MLNYSNILDTIRYILDLLEKNKELKQKDSNFT